MMRIKIKCFGIALLIFLFSMNLSAFAVEEPVVNAEATILVEATTGKVLYEKNSNEKMYPASMTKIMTSLVVLDHFSPDALVIVGSEVNEISWDSSKAGHRRGETLSVENLLRGLMIPSGNDSANVLAVAVAKKVKNDENLSFEACQQIFTELMNEKAKELGAANTHFTNAHGYHDPNHYSSAYDMALFAKEAMKSDLIKQIASEKNFSGNGAGNTLESNTSLRTQDYNWTSHNLLITSGDYYYQYATGLKTGFTDEAGSCITATAEKDGKQLIAVIFNSEDPGRWQDSITLFEYGFNNFNYVEIQKGGDKVDEVGLSNHNRLNGDTLDVIVKDDVIEFLSEEQETKIEKTIQYKEELLTKNKNEEDKSIHLIAPIEKDSEIGTVQYLLDGQVIREAKLYAGSDIEKNTIISSIKFFFKNIFTHLFTIKGALIAVGIVVGVVVLVFIVKMIKRRRSKYRYRYKPIKRKRFK